MKGALSTVPAIGSDIRRYRKVRANIIELMKYHHSMLSGTRRGTIQDAETRQQGGSGSHHSSFGSAPDKSKFVDIGAAVEQLQDLINPRSEEHGPDTVFDEAEPTADVCDSGDDVSELTRNASRVSDGAPRRARLIMKND